MKAMTLLLGIAAFGSASCAYILHELRKAPLGIEVAGKFFLCERRAPSTPYASAADAAVAGGNMVRS